jgi:hypothetical protein
MVYPNQVISNNGWESNVGVGILLALGENDNMWIYNASAINTIHLGMPQDVVNCQLRIRDIGSGPINTPAYFELSFYRNNNLVHSETISATNDWTTHTLTVPQWNSVVIVVDFGGVGAIDFLRAESLGGFPTRRALTGVGV